MVAFDPVSASAGIQLQYQYEAVKTTKVWSGPVTFHELSRTNTDQSSTQSSILEYSSQSSTSQFSSGPSPSSDDSGYEADLERLKRCQSGLGGPVVCITTESKCAEISRTNPRRTKPKDSVQASLPPKLVRSPDASASFVNILIFFTTSLVSSVWPLSEPRPGTVGSNRAGIPLVTFVTESLRRSNTSYSTLQVALYYIVLLKANLPKHDFTQEQPKGGPRLVLQCGRRMFLSALMLAAKYLQDKNYSSLAWEKISGLKCSEINHNELLFLTRIDFRAHVPKEVFDNWSRLVLELCHHTKRLGSQGRLDQAREPIRHARWESFVKALNPNIFQDIQSTSNLLRAVVQDDFSIPTFPSPTSVLQLLTPPATPPHLEPESEGSFEAIAFSTPAVEPVRQSKSSQFPPRFDYAAAVDPSAALNPNPLPSPATLPNQNSGATARLLAMQSDSTARTVVDLTQSEEEEEEEEESEDECSSETENSSPSRSRSSSVSSISSLEQVLNVSKGKSERSTVAISTDSMANKSELCKGNFSGNARSEAAETLLMLAMQFGPNKANDVRDCSQPTRRHHKRTLSGMNDLQRETVRLLSDESKSQHQVLPDPITASDGHTSTKEVRLAHRTWAHARLPVTVPGSGNRKRVAADPACKIEMSALEMAACQLRRDIRPARRNR